MELPRHPGLDDAAPKPPPSRRTRLVAAAIVAALIGMIALHLSGVIGAR